MVTHQSNWDKTTGKVTKVTECCKSIYPDLTELATHEFWNRIPCMIINVICALIDKTEFSYLSLPEYDEHNQHYLYKNNVGIFRSIIHPEKGWLCSGSDYMPLWDGNKNILYFGTPEAAAEWLERTRKNIC